MTAKLDQRINEPNNKESFGHVLFRIIGKDADWHEAAKNLGAGFGRLKGYIHSTHILPLAEIESKKWRQILSRHYPDGWKANSAEFELLIAGNRKLHGDKIPANNANSLAVEWRAEVGKLLRIIREESGMKLDDVARAAGAIPVVARNLAALEEGSDLYGWSTYRAAAFAIYKTCGPEPDDPSVTKILSRLRAAQPGVPVTAGP